MIKTSPIPVYPWTCCNGEDPASAPLLNKIWLIWLSIVFIVNCYLLFIVDYFGGSSQIWQFCYTNLSSDSEFSNVSSVLTSTIYRIILLYKYVKIHCLNIEWSTLYFYISPYPCLLVMKIGCKSDFPPQFHHTQLYYKKK